MFITANIPHKMYIVLSSQCQLRRGMVWRLRTTLCEQLVCLRGESIRMAMHRMGLEVISHSSYFAPRIPQLNWKLYQIQVVDLFMVLHTSWYIELVLHSIFSQVCYHWSLSSNESANQCRSLLLGELHSLCRFCVLELWVAIKCF